MSQSLFYVGQVLVLPKVFFICLFIFHLRNPHWTVYKSTTLSVYSFFFFFFFFQYFSTYLQLVEKVGNFPGGPVVKNLPANPGDMGLVPGPGRFHMPQSS